jgi:hypothetical protein
VIQGGAVSDYAGNLGDPSPGATGLNTDFYYGGNGNGVIITSRPRCADFKPVDWIDHLGLSDIADGTSNVILAGEAHVPIGELNRMPHNAAAYNGYHFSAYARVGGIGVPIARPHDPEPLAFAFGSWHPNVCHFVNVDGSVRVLSQQVNTVVLGRLCNRGDNKVASE